MQWFMVSIPWRCPAKHKVLIWISILFCMFFCCYK
jgi:hypothetical protein